MASAREPNKRGKIKVVAKCPYYDCGKEHIVLMHYKPPIKPRIACIDHEYCRRKTEDGYEGVDERSGKENEK